MATIQQWRALIGNYASKTGSCRWRPSCFSRTRITINENKDLEDEDIFASSKLQGNGTVSFSMVVQIFLASILFFGLFYSIPVNRDNGKPRLEFLNKTSTREISEIVNAAVTVIQMGLIISGDVEVNPGPNTYVSTFYTILTISSLILHCQASIQHDFLSTRFQLSKNNAKNVTVIIPPNMNNGCQVGLIIEIKSEQLYTEDKSHNSTDEIRFEVKHPNIPENQEHFSISSNKVEFHWKKILHKLCFINCEHVSKNSLFITATTDITEVRNITITPVKGSDHCKEINKMTKNNNDPWKIPAIISVIIAILLFIFAIILVIKKKPKTIDIKDQTVVKEELLTVM